MIKFSKFIHLKTFIFSFIIGFIYVYLLDPFEIISVYPTPNNTNKLLFKDNANNCYKFKSEIINCPTDFTIVKNIPVQ